MSNNTLTPLWTVTDCYFFCLLLVSQTSPCPTQEGAVQGCGYQEERGSLGPPWRLATISSILDSMFFVLVGYIFWWHAEKGCLGSSLFQMSHLWSDQIRSVTQSVFIPEWGFWFRILGWKHFSSEFWGLYSLSCSFQSYYWKVWCHCECLLLCTPCLCVLETFRLFSLSLVFWSFILCVGFFFFFLLHTFVYCPGYAMALSIWKLKLFNSVKLSFIKNKVFYLLVIFSVISFWGHICYMVNLYWFFAFLCIILFSTNVSLICFLKDFLNFISQDFYWFLKFCFYIFNF